MKIKSNTVILILLLFLFLSTSSLLNLQTNRDNNIQESILSNLNTSATYTTSIVIDDMPGSLNNWTWAKDQGICTGSGTASSPYRIRNHFFNTSSINTNCLTISNSIKYFRIEDCTFNGSPSWAAIHLYNTTNGYITRNSNIGYTGAFVWLIYSNDNRIIGNNASLCSVYAILLEATSTENIISENIVSFNLDAGIYIDSDSDTNLIEDNIIHLNPYGIFFDSSSSSNIVRGNSISNSTIYGVVLDGSTSSNKFYSNCFIGNANHVLDDGGSTWDEDGKENYWDDYLGSDTDGDGIGDVPYDISGSSGSQDSYPLMSCPKKGTSGEEGIPGYDITILFSSVLSITIITTYIALKKKNFNF